MANLKESGFRYREGEGLDWHDVTSLQETDLLTERNAGYCHRQHNVGNRELIITDISSIFLLCLPDQLPMYIL